MNKINPTFYYKYIIDYGINLRSLLVNIFIML